MSQREVANKVTSKLASKLASKVANKVATNVGSKLLTGLCLCGWLAGCAELAPVVAPTGSPVAPLVSQSSRLPIKSIDLAGRLSVRYQKDGRDEALHGSFTWSQRPDTTTINLLSPLGQTLAVITITPAAATIQQSGQPARSAADPNALVADALGWPLPIAGLRDWLQGFAIDAQGSLRTIAATDTTALRTADGWTLQYAVWDNNDAAHPHPKRIDLSRQTTEAGEVAIRLVIDEWQPQ